MTRGIIISRSALKSLYRYHERTDYLNAVKAAPSLQAAFLLQLGYNASKGFPQGSSGPRTIPVG